MRLHGTQATTCQSCMCSLSALRIGPARSATCAGPSAKPSSQLPEARVRSAQQSVHDTCRKHSEKRAQNGTQAREEYQTTFTAGSRWDGRRTVPAADDMSTREAEVEVTTLLYGTQVAGASATNMQANLGPARLGPILQPSHGKVRQA